MGADQQVIELTKGISFGKASAAIIEITKEKVEPDAVRKSSAAGKSYAYWGPDNNQPQRIIDTNMQETTSAGALEFKIKAHFGKGLYFFKESINGKGEEVKTPVLIRDLPAAIQEFWFNNRLQTLQYGIVSNFEWFGFYPLQYICNSNFSKIVRIHAHRAKDWRSGKKNINHGEITSSFLSGRWPTPNEDETTEVPAFSMDNPFAVANGIYKHEFPSIDRDYYPTPYWQSNMRWMEVAMKIPRWIVSNINNSVNLKYHVEIPEQYFIDLYPVKNYESLEKCIAARKEAEEELKKNIDLCLAGEDNAQKIFYTKFAIDSQGNVRPGWKINELKNDIKDTAWLNADATAAARISSAHGVNPSLTALVTGSNLNVGSGSDTREKFNVHMQLHTVLPRQKTLEWFDDVSRINKWPQEFKLGYRDLTLETLATAKQGFVVQNESSPTAL